MTAPQGPPDPLPLPLFPARTRTPGADLMTSLTGWKPRPGSAVRVLRDASNLDHHGAPGVWMVVDKHPDKGSWWLQPYDKASRIWADTHPDKVKTMHRPGDMLLSAAMPLPKGVR